jgi:hypothetical protein
MYAEAGVMSAATLVPVQPRQIHCRATAVAKENVNVYKYILYPTMICTVLKKKSVLGYVYWNLIQYVTAYFDTIKLEEFELNLKCWFLKPWLS